MNALKKHHIVLVRKASLSLFLIAALLFSHVAFANTCTWVSGSTKNWSDTTAWTLCGSVAPTAADDVVVAGTGTLTIDGSSASPSLARSVNFTGFTGTLTHASAKQLNIGDGTAGVFTLVSGMTYAPNAAAVLKFVSTTTGNNITSGGKTMPLVTFDGIGGKWTLQDAWTSSTRDITLTNGHLDTNGQTVTAGLSSSNSNTRALTLGATTWTITNSSNANWDIGTSTGMTLSAASSTISLGITTGTGFVFNGGGLTYGTVSDTVLTSGDVTINQSNTFGTLTLSEAASIAGSYRFQSGTTQTVTGTFTSNGNSVINRAYLRATTVGSSATISANTFTFTNIDLQDITKAGAGSGNIAAITGLSGDCGGNSGWTFTTPVTNYWVPTGGTSTGNESAVTRWANASNGTAGTGRSPLPQDTARFDGSSIDAGSRTITQDKPRIGPHIWTGVTNTPGWTRSTVTSFYGNITLVSGMTVAIGATAYTYMGSGNSTYTTAGLTQINPLVIDSGNGTLTQGDSFTSSSTLTGTSGAFAGASTYTTSFTTCTWNGGTFTETGNMTLTGALSVTGGTFMSGVGTVSGGTTSTFSGGTANLKGFSGTTTTISGGTATIGSTGLAGSTLTVSSGTFNLNGASTGMTGSVTVSGGTWNLNANYTTSSNTFTHATAIGTINITSATLTIGTVLAVVGAGTGGGGGGSCTVGY